MLHPEATVCTLVAAVVASAALPAQDAVSRAEGGGRAETLLRDAAAAAARFEGARYHAIGTRRLLLANRIWRAEGTVSVQRGGALTGHDGPVRVYVDGEVVLPGETESTPARLARDGARWSFADDGRGAWAEGSDENIGGDPSSLLAGLMPEAVLGPEPYAGERLVDVRGPETFGRNRYWVIETESPDELRASTWYLATSDLLPRQCDRRTQLDQGEELVERVLYGELEPIPEGLALRLEAPAGYGAIDAEAETVLGRALVPWRERQPDVVSLEASLEPLRRAFEAARGKPRVLGLFAPS